MGFHKNQFVKGYRALRLSYGPIHGWNVWTGPKGLTKAADILLAIKLGRALKPHEKATFLDGNNDNLNLDNLELSND